MLLFVSEPRLTKNWKKTSILSELEQRNHIKSIGDAHLLKSAQTGDLWTQSSFFSKLQNLIEVNGIAARWLSQWSGEGRGEHVICQLECCTQDCVCVRCRIKVKAQHSARAVTLSCWRRYSCMCVRACVITMLSEQMELRVPDIQSSWLNDQIGVCVALSNKCIMRELPPRATDKHRDAHQSHSSS